MVTAAVLLAVAAVLGAALLLRHLRRQELPLGLAVLHGLAAVLGVAFLLAAVLQGAPAPAGWALGLLVVAALGGLVLLAQHLRDRPLPTPLVAVHGLLAVAAFILLLVALSG